MMIKSVISKDQVVSEFLRAEWYKEQYDSDRSSYSAIVLNPDFLNPIENAKRHELLWRFRWPLLQQLPTDIIWYAAEINDIDFSKLLIIRENGWDRTFGMHKTLESAVKAMMTGTLIDCGVKFDIVYSDPSPLN